METVFTWVGSIILPVIAIVIAICSSRQTSKDATRQIESVKRLAEIQIETTLRQIEVEIQKNRLLGQQAREEWQKIRDLKNSQLGGNEDYRNHRKREIEEERPREQMEFYNTYIQSLNEISGKLIKLKKKLNK
ncbi:hypothetical protein [Butyricimonas paravirosa]|jgi:hypothetical protein|uniref:hypothetical protein n=1 Tax=Butyricimonas paravirosa TaxID=1472417 RepID=UPI00242AA4BA|nr:hypothetical protein [Butyricimonas paravirosa]